MIARTFPLTTDRENSGGFLRRSLRIVLLLLIAVCVFDPADKLLGAKVPLFVLGWILFIFDITINRKIIYIPMRMILYLILFIFFIPLLSIYYYFLINGDLINYDGYVYFKPYLFITLVLIVYVSAIDLLKPAITIISLLSIVTLVMFAIEIYNGPLAMYLYAEVGEKYGIFGIGSRNYGSLVFPQVYFVTAPLIVFPIGYFTKAFVDFQGRAKIFYGFLLVINMAAMFLGATRNNMFVSILITVFIFCWYSKNKPLMFFSMISLFSIILFGPIDIIRSMFDTEEPSNAWKLVILNDYIRLFGNGKILLFGQGLGSYFDTTLRGYVSVTELTYFEFIRRFGLILSIVSFILILYPLKMILLKNIYREHYIYISYMFYLIMCFSNPLLMSSTGMLLLSLVLYKTFSSQ